MGDLGVETEPDLLLRYAKFDTERDRLEGWTVDSKAETPDGVTLLWKVIDGFVCRCWLTDAPCPA